MKKIKTTDNTLVGVAVGKEDGVWYVQLTDLGDDSDPSKTTYLSEGIAEGLSSKEEALALANKYVKRYGFKLFEWDN